MEFVFQRTPVNVEKATVDRSLPVFENVQPPRIIAAHHCHVIWNNVEDQSHAVLVEFGHETVELLGAANFWVESVVIYDVVSMHAAGASLQAGRDVTVTHAKRGKIRDYRSSLSEGEIAIELQAIGRERDLRESLHGSRSHTTDHAGNGPRFRASMLSSS